MTEAARGSGTAGRLIRTSGVVGGWSIVTGLAAVVVARLVAFDETQVLVWLNAFTVWLFLPVYAVAPLAASMRRPVLTVAALCLVVIHLSWVVPPMFGAEAVPAAAHGAPRVRVLTANLSFDNPTPDLLARELLEHDADVLVLQEVTPQWVEVLERTGVLERYSHGVVVPREDAGGQAIYSRLRLEEERATDVGVWPQLQATIVMGGRRVTLVDVHPVQPLTGYRHYRAQVPELHRMLTSAAVAGPVIAAGDFNATVHNRFVADLLDASFRCAHVARGRGWATTWPNGEKLVPPIALDHVLVSSDIAVLDVREGDGAGSDHRPVIADLALLPNRAEDR